MDSVVSDDGSLSVVRDPVLRRIQINGVETTLIDGTPPILHEGLMHLTGLHGGISKQPRTAWVLGAMALAGQRLLKGGGPNCAAIFSRCRTWRYSLWRVWGDEPIMMVIGLNPSVADETQDDPTVRRCIRFARDLGYGGLVMTNMFGYRSTDPRGLDKVFDPNGPDNDRSLREIAARAGIVVAAWGADKATRSRLPGLKRVLEDVSIHCLARTKDGLPRHPLYLKASCVPELWEWPPDLEAIKLAGMVNGLRTEANDLAELAF